MIREELKKEFAFNEKISNVILIFLLLVRLTDQDISVWIFGTHVPDWFGYWYTGLAYILTAIIVFLNRHRLGALNIDRSFVSILILGGLAVIGWKSNNIGVSVGLTAGLIWWAYANNHLVFKNPVPYPKEIRLLIFVTILLALAPIVIFHLTLKSPLSSHIFAMAFWITLVTELAAIVFEEVIFRGALWAFLRSLGFGEQVSVLIQAVLFWISHHGYLSLSSPYPFWVSLPISALLYGLLAWRSKSLTPSTIAHFLYNFIVQLLIAIF